LNVHTLKPLDGDAIAEAARMSSALLTVEEHSIVGGLGSAVAEILAEGKFHKVKFQRLGIPDTFCKIGTQEELTKAYGLDCVGITNAANKILLS
jgi:transketolase